MRILWSVVYFKIRTGSTCSLEMPKVDSKKDQSVKSRRDERAQSSAPYPGSDERIGAIASMLEAGDGSAYMNPEDLEARTALDNAECEGNEDDDHAEDGKPSFNALTAAEMNVRTLLFFWFQELVLVEMLGAF